MNAYTIINVGDTCYRRQSDKSFFAIRWAGSFEQFSNLPLAGRLKRRVNRHRAKQTAQDAGRARRGRSAKSKKARWRNEPNFSGGLMDGNAYMAKVYGEHVARRRLENEAN